MRQKKDRRKWREYERQKAKLQGMMLSPEKYEAALKQLAKKLKV